MNNAIWTGLYSKLSGGTALIAALGGTAIYHQQPPEGAALPYVIFGWAGGGLQPLNSHTLANGIIRIRAFSDVDDSEAGAIRDEVFTLIDKGSLTITGWSQLWLRAEAPHIEMVETDESGVTVWSSGDDYRIIADKN